MAGLKGHRIIITIFIAVPFNPAFFYITIKAAAATPHTRNKITPQLCVCVCESVFFSEQVNFPCDHLGAVGGAAASQHS